MSLPRRELQIEGTVVSVAVLGAALAILAVGLYIGPRAYLNRGGVARHMIVPTTFAAWESRPASEHFFLVFLTPEDLAAGRAYTHYSHPLVFAQYLYLQPFRWLGVPYERSQVWLCLPQFAVILLLLGVHLRDPRRFALWPLKALPLFRIVVVVAAVAAVMTLPQFWVPFFRETPEHYFFLPALAFCHLAAADYRGTLRARDAFVALVPIALFAPVFTPFLAVSWLVLWGLGSERIDWRIVGWLAAITALGVILFELPGFLERFSSVIATGSGYRFRSGLDGDVHYFTSMAQAIWAPWDLTTRVWPLWQWPLAAFAAIGLAAMRSPTSAARMLRQLFIAWVPYLWFVIVFPQAVSIHPYLGDFGIAFGSAFCLAFWATRPELEAWSEAPALRLAISMVFAALLMTNMLDLARVGVAPVG